MRAAMSPTELVRSTFSLLAASVLAMGPVSRLDAQERAQKKAGITSATTTAVPATVVTPGSVGRTTRGSPDLGPNSADLVALRTTSDLIITNLGFTAEGKITFELRNRGEVPINPPPGDVPQAKQIAVSAYVNNSGVQTLYWPRLGGKESKTFTLHIQQQPLRPICGGYPMLLKTVIDPMG